MFALPKITKENEDLIIKSHGKVLIEDSIRRREETSQTKSNSNWTVRTSIGRMQSSVDRVQKIRIRYNSKSSLKGNFAVSSLVHYYQFIPGLS